MWLLPSGDFKLVYLRVKTSFFDVKVVLEMFCRCLVRDKSATEK